MIEGLSVEAAQHARSTPGNPRIDDAHYPEGSRGERIPTPATPAEAEFLALGPGAALWLQEAAETRAQRASARMTDAVALAKLHGIDAVDRALGTAATVERFADGDLMAILAHHVREVPPGDPGPVHVEDRVQQAPQVVVRRPAGVQNAAAALGPPRGQDRDDQLPPGIGQTTRVTATFRQDHGLLTHSRPCSGVRPGARSARRAIRRLGMKQDPPSQHAPRIATSSPRATLASAAPGSPKHKPPKKAHAIGLNTPLLIVSE